MKVIAGYQRFCFTAAKYVEVEMSCSDKFQDRTINILNVPGTSFTMSDLPLVLEPGGLSRDRSAYLLMEIQQFCHEESHNITCPEPPPVIECAADIPSSKTLSNSQ